MTSLQTRYYLTSEFYSIRNRIHLKFFIPILSFAFNACDLNGVKCIKYGHSKEHEIYVHSVGGAAVDSVSWANYDLVITNYINNSMTVKEFIDIARKFVDTAKSKQPIGDIIF